MTSHLAFRFFQRVYANAVKLATSVLRRHQQKRLRIGKEHPERFSEREGIPSVRRPDGEIVWFHGASIGEAIAALPVIEHLVREFHDVSVLLTTGTVTSAEIISTRLPVQTIHQFTPIDHPSWVTNFLDHWNPTAAVWLESEFWPNTLYAIHKRNIPLVLLNGRVSKRTYDRWRRFPFLASGMMSYFVLILARSLEDETRLTSLGASNVKRIGDIKRGAPPLPCDPAVLQDIESHIVDRPRWLMSSTHVGEEQLGADIHQVLAKKVPGLLTVITPRHPERGTEIAKSLANQGFQVALRSIGEGIQPSTSIYVCDTIGELGLWYRVCKLVFMGKSLITPGGGQNPFEPIQLGCSVVFGPNMSNFEELSAEIVNEGAAIQVTSPEELGAEIEKQLTDHHTTQKVIENAETYSKKSRHVIAETVDELATVWKRR